MLQRQWLMPVHDYNWAIEVLRIWFNYQLCLHIGVKRSSALAGDSLANPGLMQAKQNVWNASSHQPMATAAGPGNAAMNSLSLVSPPNVNIGSASALPPNINIQNISGLQGLGLVNLQVDTRVKSVFSYHGHECGQYACRHILSGCRTHWQWPI